MAKTVETARNASIACIEVVSRVYGADVTRPGRPYLIVVLHWRTNKSLFSLLFCEFVLAGILLPAGRAWLLGILSILCFAILFYFHTPIAELHSPQRIPTAFYRSRISLADKGLLVAFATCSSVIVYFVTRLTVELQRRDSALRTAEMLKARGEKWEALGTLSAGAAHELATPLTTIAIVAKEIERDLCNPNGCKTFRDDMQVIRREVNRCRVILDRMSIDAGHATAEARTVVAADQLVDLTLDEMSVIQDRIKRFTNKGLKGCLLDVPLQSLLQALRGVLQNALDASVEPVEFHVDRQGDFLSIMIRDHGTGMNAEILARADEPFFTTKEAGKGMGLGRFLARAIFDRLGGTFDTESTPNVGTTVTLKLPLVKTGNVYRG